MNMTEIKVKAKDLGVKIGKLGKGNLIRAIQTKEGNFPCFETAREYCSQKACCWRDACLPSRKIMPEWEKKKKSYTRKVAAELKGLKKQLADLEKRGEKLVGKAQQEARAEINKLEKKLAALKKKGHKLTAAGEDYWRSVKKGIADAWEDL